MLAIPTPEEVLGVFDHQGIRDFEAGTSIQFGCRRPAQRKFIEAHLI